MARRRGAPAWAGAVVLGLVALAATGASAQCTNPPERPAIATFESSSAFNAGQNNLGGTLTQTGGMAEFVRATNRGNHLRLRPGSAASAWSAAVPPPQQANYPMTAATGAVVAFDVGTGDPSSFKVAILTRPQGSPGATPTDRYELDAQPYVPTEPQTPGSLWTTVRIPIQHFQVLPNRMLAGVEFRGFAGPYGAGATPIRFDNLRIEYRRCPRRLAAVPVQTCRAASLLVDDFRDAGRFANRRNALGGAWSDDQTMSSVQFLTASDPRGPGLLMSGNNASYWYTFLRAPNGGPACVNPWPYTALRVELSASRGLQLDVEFKPVADDCATKVNISAVRVPTHLYTEFSGLTQVVTIDIRLGRLHRNPLGLLAVSGFYRRPGDPTDGTSTVILRRMTFVRDCVQLAEEMTEPVPPVIDYCGPSDEPLVALTFDGPSSWTDGVIEYLASQSIKATFFIQPGAIVDRPKSADPYNDPDYYPYGYPLQQAPNSEFCKLVKRIIAAGHTIGDHSFTHPRFPSLTPAHQEAELERPYRFYMDCLGYVPTMFRAPYGELTPTQVNIFGARGFSVIQWNFESNDHIVCSDPPTLENVKAGIRMANLTHGALPQSNIMLSHDECTNLALPSVVEYFKSLGYKFITMDECRERCIDRAYPDQPAAEADHRGCQDPYNPTEYSASQLLVGQYWLRWVSTITTPQPLALGISYPYMAPASTPFVAPTIVPGLRTPPPTDAPTLPPGTPTGSGCFFGGGVLAVRPPGAPDLLCLLIYNGAYQFLGMARIVDGVAILPAAATNGAASLIVEGYSNTGCWQFARSFTCPVTVFVSGTVPPTTQAPTALPPTAPPPTTPPPTTPPPTTPAPTSTAPPTLPPGTPAGSGCFYGGGVLAVRPPGAPDLLCLLIYNGAYQFLGMARIIDGAAILPAEAANGATSLIVEGYSNTGCWQFARSFTCPITTFTSGTLPPSTPPSTTAPPSTLPPTTAPPITAPPGTPNFPPGGPGCLWSGATLYVYNLPTNARCVLGYRLPLYEVELDAAATAANRYVAFPDAPGGVSRAFEVYAARTGSYDCSGFITTVSC